MTPTNPIILALLAVFCCYVLAKEEGLYTIRANIRDANLNVTKTERGIKEEAIHIEDAADVNSIHQRFDFTTIFNQFKELVKNLTKEAEAAGKDVKNCTLDSNAEFFRIENETSYSFLDCNDDYVTQINKVADVAIRSIPDLYAIETEAINKYNGCSDGPCREQVDYIAGIQVEKVLLIAQHAAELAHLDFKLILGGPNCFSNVNKAGKGEANNTYETCKKCVAASDSIIDDDDNDDA